ncbi:MAG: PAS domain-containing protein [Thermanaerothrix sp.]|nr:PAS domain-containing protein [Thermanaerothrix sp.]
MHYKMRKGIPMQEGQHTKGGPRDLNWFLEGHRGLIIGFPKGMIVLSPRGEVALCNRAALNLLGFDPSTECERLQDLEAFTFNGDVEVSLDEALNEALSRGSFDSNCLIKTPWGALRPLNLSVTPIKNPDGETIGLLCILTGLDELWKRQEELKESDRRHRELFTLLRTMCDNVPDMIWAKDLNKRYIFANRALAEKLLNAKDTDEPIGKTDLFFATRERESHPEDPQWHTFGEICQDSDLLTLEAMAPSRFDEWGNVKGKFLFLDVHKAPFFDQNGMLIGTVGCGRDITKEKAMEQELLESRRRLKLALECGDIYAWEWDIPGGTITVNPSPDDEGDGVSSPSEEVVFGRIHPEDAPEVRAKVDEVLADNHGTFDHIFRRRNRLGQWEWIWCKGAVVERQEGRPTRITGVARNVSERMEAIRALSRSESRYRALFEGSMDGLLVLGSDSLLIVEANGAARRLLGRDDPIGLKVLFYPISGEAERPLTAQELADRIGSTPLEVFASVSGGAPSPVEVLAKWIDLNEGQRGILVILRNLAPVLKMRTQLLQAHKMRALSTMAEGMGHELNNILAPLQGYSEMGLSGMMPPETCFAKILDGVKRARELTMKLMMTNRPPVEAPDTIDLREFVERHVPILSESAPEGISVSWSVPDRPLPVRLIMEHARQVLLHLWSNAIWAVSPGGRIEISLREANVDPSQAALNPNLSEGSYAVLSVRDDGCGMDEVTKARAPEPFFSSRVPLGSGLGLSVVHGLITHHQGAVVIESTPNEGTTVHLYIPLCGR